MIVNKNSIIVSLRNPQKLLHLFSFVYTVLLCLGVEESIKTLHKLQINLSKKITTLGVVVLFVAVFILQSPALLSGDFGRSVFGADYYLDNGKYNVLFDKLRQIDADSKILYLPYTRPIQLKMLSETKLVGYPLGKVREDNSNTPILFKSLISSLCNNENFQSYLDKFQVQYVILDKTAKNDDASGVINDCVVFDSYGTPYISGSYSYFNRLFNDYPVFFENQNFKIVNSKKKNNYNVYSVKPSYAYQGHLSTVDLPSEPEDPFLITSKFSQSAKGITYLSDIFFVPNQTFATSTQPELNYNALYINKEYNTVTAIVNDNLLKLYIHTNKLYANNTLIQQNVASSTNFFSSLKLDPVDDYYIQEKNRLLKIGKITKLDLGSIKLNSILKLYKIGLNIVENNSFENGSWQREVGDCDNYDNNGLLSMSLNTEEKTDGKQSLQLEAKRHIACITRRFPLMKSGDYAFSFDYQSTKSKRAGYYLEFNNPAKTIISQKLTISGNGWQTFTKNVQVPEGSSEVSLYLYAYESDGIMNNIVRYDNIKFGKLELVKTIEIPKEEGFEKIPIKLTEGENTFEYKDDRYTYQNQIENPSFEDGSWQKEVGDCNHKDDNGLMAMSIDSNEKTDGNQSLRLEATRHYACVSTQIPVNSGSTYTFSFDYQSPNSKQANYFIGYNDKAETNISESLSLKDKDWHNFSVTIKIPDDATLLSLFVYARESDEQTNNIVRYDNFKLIEVPDLTNLYYLVNEQKEKLVQPKSVDFKLINPTKKSVHISGATTSFFLAMSESYHDQWQLQIDNQKIHGFLNGWWPFAKPDQVGDEYHYKLDGFLNAWYVDVNDICVKQHQCKQNADGSYDIDMVIEFWPQRWFYLGLLISGTTLAGCLGYLGYEGVKSARRKLKERKEKKYEKTV